MWEVLIHPLVFKEDFRKIDGFHQRQLIKTLRKKLSRDPKTFGKPLTGDLKGYYRLRIEDYRVIYSIVEDQVVVKVVKIGIRCDSKVYEEMALRLPKVLEN